MISRRVVRSRAQIHSAAKQPKIIPLPDGDDDDETEFWHDDDKSKSSWGAGKITAQKSVTKRAGSTYSGESSTNAKSDHRLTSTDSSAARLSSRRAFTQSRRRPALSSNKEHSVSVTVTRPVWDGATRTPARSVQSTKRSRKSATRTTTAPLNKPLYGSSDDTWDAW